MRDYAVVETKEGPRNIDLRVSVGENATEEEIIEVASHLSGNVYRKKTQVMIMFFRDEEHAQRARFKQEYRYCTYYRIGHSPARWIWDRTEAKED